MGVYIFLPFDFFTCANSLALVWFCQVNREKKLQVVDIYAAWTALVANARCGKLSIKGFFPHFKKKLVMDKCGREKVGF